MKKIKGDTQNLIITLCWFVYASAYFGRYSFSSSINSIIDNYGISKAETGLVMTFFFVAYGVGQVINGILCRRYSAKYIFPVALCSSSLINVLMFVLIKTGYIAEYFFAVKYIWMLNGAVQSLIWTSIIYVLGQNIETANISRAGLVIGTTVPGGTFIAYSSSSLLEHFGFFEISFVLAAVVMTAVAVCWLLFFTPHKRRDLENPATQDDAPAPAGRHKIPRGVLITVAGLSVFAVSNNYIKDGLQTWIPTLLKDIYNFSKPAALILATSIYVLGILGSFLVKKLNKKIKNLLSLSIFFFLVTAAFIGAIFGFLKVSYIPVILFFATVMICGYGVNNVITSLAPLTLRDDINPGVSAGVLDGFCYIGSALSTYTLGIIADRFDWGAVILTLLFITLFSTVTASVLRFVSKQKA